jgi:hypothetical protein
MRNKDVKVGQIVRITGNHNEHEFEIGQRVKIVEICPPIADIQEYKAESLVPPRGFWYLLAKDMELVGDFEEKEV